MKGAQECPPPQHAWRNPSGCDPDVLMGDLIQSTGLFTMRHGRGSESTLDSPSEVKYFFSKAEFGAGSCLCLF